MALLQNSRVLNAEPIRVFGGAAIGTYSDRWCYNRPEMQMNSLVGESSMSAKGSYPDGYAPPYQIEMPIKEGGMSAFGGIVGVGTSSVLSKLVKVGAMVSRTNPKMGSGTIPNSVSLSLLVQMFANITGSGQIEDSDLKNILNMAVTLNGSGEISNTTLLAILAWMNITITGSGTLDGSVMKGWADMAASIVVTGDLVTAQSCAAAVWDALITDHQDTGSTGKALSDAGAAGNPWSAIAADNNDTATMGEKINSVGLTAEQEKQLKATLKLGQFLALQ